MPSAGSEQATAQFAHGPTAEAPGAGPSHARRQLGTSAQSRQTVKQDQVIRLQDWEYYMQEHFRIRAKIPRDTANEDVSVAEVHILVYSQC